MMGEEATRCRAMVVRCSLLGCGRPDVHYAAQEASRRMAKPCRVAHEKITRTQKYTFVRLVVAHLATADGAQMTSSLWRPAPRVSKECAATWKRLAAAREPGLDRRSSGRGVGNPVRVGDHNLLVDATMVFLGALICGDRTGPAGHGVGMA